MPIGLRLHRARIVGGPKLEEASRLILNYSGEPPLPLSSGVFLVRISGHFVCFVGQ